MSEKIVQHLSSQRASCKRLSVFLTVVLLLVGGVTRLNVTNLLLAAAPLILVALVDAAYAATQRSCAETIKPEAEHQSVCLLYESASVSIFGLLRSVRSLSIWPFYLALFGLVAIGAFSLRSTRFSLQSSQSMPRQTTFQASRLPLQVDSGAASIEPRYQNPNEPAFTIEGIPKQLEQQTAQPSPQKVAKPVNYAARPFGKAAASFQSPTQTARPMSLSRPDGNVR